jgi:hypothetical protein
MTRRLPGGIGTVLVAAVLVVAGCADDDVPAAGDDSAALCAIFNELAASGAGPDAQFRASTPEGWERRIATTGEMVEAAPAEWRDEAATYLQMVKDRAQLAAENGYVGVNDLPADVRNAFISAHHEMQAEVDALIAYMGSECRASS